MNKILMAVVFLMAAAFITAEASLTNEITVTVGGQKVNFGQPPVTLDGSAYAPTRFVAEQMGWAEGTPSSGQAL